MFDFPVGTTPGQTVTGPNGVQYVWDGVKWKGGVSQLPAVTISDTAPSSPTAGALWFDSVGTQLYAYYNDGNSSQWVNTTSGIGLPMSGGTLTGPLVLVADPTTALGAATKEYVDNAAASISISDTAPTSPKVGALWFDSVGTQTYIWYNDGNTTQWVPVINQTGNVGEAPTDGGYYARQNSAWSNIATYVQTAVAPALNATGRNLLHNALFNIQQRGTGPWTSASAYTADRWTYGVGGSGATNSVSIITLTDADRAAIGDEAAIYAFQHVFVSGTDTGTLTDFSQRMENPRRLCGKTMTVSFWAKGSTTLNLGILGTTTISGVKTNNTPAVVAIGTTWARYSVTFTMPTGQGNTFGSNDNAVVYFTLSAGSTVSAQYGNTGLQSGTMQFWGMQLEVGTVTTPLEKIDPQQDLAKCQRFYQFGNFTMYGYNAAGGSTQQSLLFPVVMRAQPTITPNFSTQTNCGSSTMPLLTTGSGCVLNTVITAAGAFGLVGNFTASADL